MSHEPSLALFALQALGVVLLAGALTLVLRRPRLSLDASLRGGTRHGKLYLVLVNRGGFAARGVRVEVRWVRPDGSASDAERRELGLLAPGEPLRLEVRALHALIERDPEGWSAIEAVARASNALPARARLELSARAATNAGAAGAEPPVRYASAATLPCPESSDGEHLFERRSVPNDGVTEHWHVCARCRHVKREPLSAEEEATQARVRRERVARERAKMEAEWARRKREEEPPRARSRASREEEARRAREGDTFPPEIAFYALELDPTSATWEDVLAAHRRLALLHHPDRRPGIDAATRAALERRMQEINAARDRLREHFGLRASLD